MSSRSPVRRRRRDSPRDERSSRRRHGDNSSRRDRDRPRRRRDDSSRSPRDRRSGDRRSRSESPPRRRRHRSSERRDKRRRRSSSSSDGVYATEGRGRRGESRRGRDDRDGGRRSGRGGYEDQLKNKIQKLYKDYCDVYNMIREESGQIRKHSSMRFALKKLREDDKGDVKALRKLKDSDDPIDMLKCFYSEAKEVRQKLNKKYRAHFFKHSADRDSERHSRSSERYRDDDRRESRRKYDRHQRSRSHYDRDREPRERRERRDDRRDGRRSSSRRHYS